MSNELKTILSGDEARNALVGGITKLAAAVKVTLGPAGRTVVLGATPTVGVTKDGVSVAREINLPDRWENMAASLIKDVAINSEKLAGDGTTTSTVLAEAMVLAGMELINGNRTDVPLRPNVVINKLTKLVNFTVKALKNQAVKATSLEALMAVAEISANSEASGDYGLAAISAEAVHVTGKYGKVQIRDGHTDKDLLIHDSGYSFNRGLHAATTALCMSGAVRHPHVNIITTQDDINTIEELARLIDASARHLTTSGIGGPILILCNDMDDKVAGATTSMCNQIQRPIYVVRAPGAGNQQAGMLNDIAALSNSKPIPVGTLKSEELFDAVPYIGRVDDVVIDLHSTQFKFTTDVKEYADKLGAMISEQTSAHEITMIEERLARLTGGIATIYVGAHTDSERRERKDRFDDATKAVRVAYNEGTVVGGGYALLNVYPQVIAEFGDELCGLENILTVPHAQILTNAWYSDEDIEHVRNNFLTNYMYHNVMSGEDESIGKFKVVDPVMVTCTALENALSIAKLVLLSSVMVGPNGNKVNYYG